MGVGVLNREGSSSHCSHPQNVVWWSEQSYARIDFFWLKPHEVIIEQKLCVM